MSQALRGERDIYSARAHNVIFPELYNHDLFLWISFSFLEFWYQVRCMFWFPAGMSCRHWQSGVSDNDFILLSWFALKHFSTIELWLALLLFRWHHHHNRNGDNNSASKCEKLRGRVYVNDHFDSTHPKMKGILWAFLEFVQNTIRFDWSWANLCFSVF